MGEMKEERGGGTLRAGMSEINAPQLKRMEPKDTLRQFEGRDTEIKNVNRSIKTPIESNKNQGKKTQSLQKAYASAVN